VPRVEGKLGGILEGSQGFRVRVLGAKY